MFLSPTMIKEQQNKIVNLDEVIPYLAYETHNLPNLTKEAIKLHNLLSSLHLLAIHKKKGAIN